MKKMSKLLVICLFVFMIVLVIFLIFINISLEKQDELAIIIEPNTIQLEENKEDELQENIQLNASRLNISLRNIFILHDQYYIYIDHYQEQPFYPVNDQQINQLADFMHHYTNYSNICFRVVYIDSNAMHGYSYKEVRLKENQLNFEGEVVEVEINSKPIQQKDIKIENEQLKKQGIVIQPLSHIFDSHKHIDQENEEYGDLSTYNSYDELLMDFPELTEDDAIEIFEAYYNRD